MKKALIALNLLFLVIILFLACKNDKATEPTACEKIHAKSYEGQEMDGYLSVAQAKEISDAYDADAEKAYISMGGKMTKIPDAHRVWMSIDKLKQYIWQMEEVLCKQGCDLDSMGLGLHFYLAKYPDSSKIKEYGVPAIYANHQTIFITATYKGKTANVDFDPFNVGPEKCKPTPLGDMLKNPKSTKGGPIGGGEGGVLNHGTLAPPPDGAGGFPSTDDGDGSSSK